MKLNPTAWHDDGSEEAVALGGKLWRLRQHDALLQEGQDLAFVVSRMGETRIDGLFVRRGRNR